MGKWLDELSNIVETYESAVTQVPLPPSVTSGTAVLEDYRQEGDQPESTSGTSGTGCTKESAEISRREQRLSDLFREVPVHRVRSRVLGEDVLWAADDAEVPDTDLVVYRASELAALDGLDPDALRKIHDVKKELDGEVHKVRTFFSDSGFARILIDGLKWTFWAMFFGSRVDEFEFV